MNDLVKKPVQQRKRPAKTARASDPGSIIQRLRKEKELLLTELAKLSGVSASTISRIENGKISPTYGVMSRLSDALGIRWSDIVSTKAASSFAPGCRAVSRARHRGEQQTGRGIYEWLGTDLVTKAMEPTLIEAVPPDRMGAGAGEDMGGGVDLRLEGTAGLPHAALRAL